MREILISSPWFPIVGCMGAGQSYVRGGLEWKHSLAVGWSHPETDFLERWSVLKRNYDNALNNTL